MHFILHSLIYILLLGQCEPLHHDIKQDLHSEKVTTGAQQTERYLPIIVGKNVALVVNQTSTIHDIHLVDTLLNRNISIKAIFAPEHGFRGKADAGETIKDTRDKKTGIPVLSLYGNKKKPSKEDFAGIDVVVFDIQDVGVRFYTYISTLHYIMEACAEQNIPLIVLDRPNPNGYFIDGEVLDLKYQSFVGMHPIPTVYGMTIGEYAQMINGEGWLDNHIKAQLTVIPCQNYDHSTYYELPINPSPNLPDMRAILLYPSICFFEGTTLSLGRGTDKPFQYIGHPALKSAFSFIPKPTEGAKHPPLEGKFCYGQDLSSISLSEVRARKTIDLSYLIDFYKQMQDVEQKFWLDNHFIDKLAGSDQLRKQISNGDSEDSIRASWQTGLQAFKKIRSKYLLYQD
ncbi:MAG: DUF1343 domain-containing protein [Chitinophagales bacterium]|nr:DUF1343 domain-containing protein [Chitinophagales bacterium]MCZ2102095.1 DUF1343 domain-containing protein [Chitinophagales bacterium]